MNYIFSSNSVLGRISKVMCILPVLTASLSGIAGAQTTLRVVTEGLPGDPTNVMASTFRDEILKTAADDISIDFFEGRSLGNERTLIELLQANQVQVVAMGSEIVQLDRKYSIFDIPFLFASKEIARTALAGETGELLTASLRESANLRVLAFGEIGVRIITNNVRPINVPADLSGMKIRTPGSDTRIMAFQMLGAAPTPMSLGETYLALRQGALDGQENPLSVVEQNSLHEVQKYLSLTNHVYTPVFLSMNGDAWDALSEEVQAKVLAAAKIAAEATFVVSDEKDSSLLKFFEEKGVQINEPDIAAFQAAVPPIKAEIAKIVTPEFMAQIDEALK